MATSTQLSLSLHLQEPTKASHTTSTSRARKPKKCPPRKKNQPQRGMGVAQLERLRLQERWKIITESNQLESLNLQPSSQSETFVDPFGTAVPLQCGNGHFGSVDDGGLPAMIGSAVGRFNRGSFFVNPFALGSPVQTGTSADAPVAVFETSKELSSMPKMMEQQYCGNIHAFCDVCLKFNQKKRFSGEGVGYNGRIGKQISPTNGSDFQGLRIGNNIHFNGEMAGFSARATRSVNHNIYEGTDVVLHEFFPRNSGKGNSLKEMEFAAEASVAVGTSDYTGYGAYNASNYVDLSLKL